MTDLPEVAAAAGVGAIAAPGVPADAEAAVVVGALAECLAEAPTALAVALETATVDSEPHATCLPVTGRRPSVRPVSVAITPLG